MSPWHHLRVSRRLWSLLVVTLAVASCGGSDQPDSTTSLAGEVDALAPEPTAKATSAPELVPTGTPNPTATPAPALMPIPILGTGPYDVGVQTITVIDAERDRTFFVDVWFPLAPGTSGELIEYTFVTGDYFESARALDVEPTDASSDGPFPLVVYSHGSGGLRYLHSDYTETIASHGYVVAAPDHPGNTAIERVLGTPADTASIAIDRPLDVIEVLDELLGGRGQAAPFLELIDPERIALTGHSFGGYTAYAVAGGVESADGGVEPDPRIDALIPLAPAVGDGGDGSLLSSSQLASIDQPTLIIAGTDDTTTPVDPNVETPWNASSASPHYRLELVGAEHQTFTDLCDYVAVLADREGANPLVVETVVTMAEQGCSPDDMPIERARALTNTFAVTFLDSVFRNGEMFTPNTHEIPADVIYAVK